MATSPASSSRRRQHPGRILAIFTAFIALLYLLMAVAHSWSPKLGLDLRGGMTVTLTAANSTGNGTVSATSLEQARQIIQQRVDSLGVGESSVTTQGGNQIIVTVPNMQQDRLIGLVGTTAKLEFRNVYDQQQVQPTASASPSASGSASPSAGASASAPAKLSPTPGLPPAAPSARPTADAAKQPSTQQVLAWQPSSQDTQDFAKWNCGDPFPSVADQPLFACSKDKTAKYLLGPVVVKGTDVTSASSGIQQNSLTPSVQLGFSSDGQSKFTAATTYLKDQKSPKNEFAIVLDNEVVSSPYVSTVINSGASIDGKFTEDEANELANELKYGALPLAFSLSQVENVSATLGGEQLHAGLIAGAIGLLLVLLYSFLYYRGLGFVVVGSLVMAAVITYAAVVLLGQAVGFALSLPGIAGAIVAVGITADSFIVYFERIRDEIRDGRTLRTAIETGWRKARSTVIVADSVSLLSAVVLFLLALGSVKGFAFTLGLTTAIDLLIVFCFTKPLMTLLGRTSFYGRGHKWSGLDAEHMGVSRASLLGQRSRRTARTTSRRTGSARAEGAAGGSTAGGSTRSTRKDA